MPALKELHPLYAGKAVLITGGLGFIGSNLAFRLAEMGCLVTIVDSLEPKYGGNLFNIQGLENKVTVNISDIRDKNAIEHFVRDKDFIFNLAGTLSHIDSMDDPVTDLEINCVAQLAILEACRKYNSKVKILFAGTRGEYGRAEYLPIDEKHPLKPIDINGVNNIAAESYHILYNNAHGIAATSLRLTNTYGPRHQMKHPRQGVINWFIRKLIDEEVVEIYGDGSQKRDLNYVDDVVDAMLIAMADSSSNGQIFNLGGGAASLVDIVKVMIKVNGKGKFKLIHYPDKNRKVEIGDYEADHSKIKKILGWQSRVDLEEGFAKTFAYYKKFKKHYW